MAEKTYFDDADDIDLYSQCNDVQLCIGRAEKQKRVDVCVGFLNDNKNKAEEMRQVVEEAVMIRKI